MPNPGMQCNQIRPPMACDVESKEVPNLLTFRERPAGWTHQALTGIVRRWYWTAFMNTREAQFSSGRQEVDKRGEPEDSGAPFAGGRHSEARAAGHSIARERSGDPAGSSLEGPAPDPIRGRPPPQDEAEGPILIVPYMWIGDFVRCHSVVQLVKARWPERPVDVLTTTLCAPLLDYMPGVRRGIVWNLPRKRLAFGQHRALAERLSVEQYGMALIMPRTWKSALAPFLAGIPRRGFFGELRLGLLNDVRWGERALPRMVDRCASLALPAGAALPSAWRAPELAVPANEVADWRRRNAPGSGSAIALAPGAVGPSKRWPIGSYAALAQSLAERGCNIWVVGGPDEKPLAEQIITAAGNQGRDLTGPDLRNTILALAAADVAVSNDSGLLHVAAAVGTATVGIFGPTSPWHWAPLNPLAATIETRTELECRPCHKPTCRVRHHRCMQDIGPDQVLEATRRAMGVSAS